MSSLTKATEQRRDAKRKKALRKRQTKLRRELKQKR